MRSRTLEQLKKMNDEKLTKYLNEKGEYIRESNDFIIEFKGNWITYNNSDTMKLFCKYLNKYVHGMHLNYELSNEGSIYCEKTYNSKKFYEVEPIEVYKVLIQNDLIDETYNVKKKSSNWIKAVRQFNAKYIFGSTVEV